MGRTEGGGGVADMGPDTEVGPSGLLAALPFRQPIFRTINVEASCVPAVSVVSMDMPTVVPEVR